MSDIKEIRKMHEESGMENIDSRHIFALFKEIDELQQQVCDECDPDNYGWKHNAVEGRHPCTCIVESGAYQELKQQLDAVREAVPMFLEDYQVDDFWAEVKLQKILGGSDANKTRK